MTTKHIIITACSALTLLACQEKNSPDSTATATPTSSKIDGIILTSAPADSLTITEVRKSVEPGKKVTFKCKVIGSKSPFVEGRAMMIVGDSDKLTSCDIKHGDRCSTPWDVCCDDRDDIKNFTATIQVLDADGKLIKRGLKGTQGLKELSHLVVSGTIAEGSNADNLLINASGIYINP